MKRRAIIDHGLGEEDIATLTQLAEDEPAGAMTDIEPHRKASIEKLLAAGYIEPGDDDPEAPRYRLTSAGEDFLSLRGAGLNEA